MFKNIFNEKTLAYIALIYIFSCIYYLIMTRNIGTPFSDLIKKYPNIMKVKTESSKKRSEIFYNGLLIGTILLIFLRPF